MTPSRWKAAGSVSRVGVRRLGRSTCAAGLLALACAPWSCLIDPYEELTEVEVRSPRAEDCGACHVEIYREFSASRHAQSWTREAFVAATAGRAFDECLGCHAPESVYAEGEPRLRPAHREEGVTCVACHFDGEVLAGPAPSSALLEPHPIAEERPLYRSSELCGKCHEGTFEEWRESGMDERRTCQECHMPAVERTLTQATGALSALLVSFEEPFAGRSHAFHVAAVADAGDLFDVDARAPTEATARVFLTSKVPHLVPTGDFGYRRVDVVARARNADGDLVGEAERTLFKERRESIRPGSGIVLEFEVRSPAARYEVELWSVRADGEKHRVFHWSGGER